MIKQLRKKLGKGKTGRRSMVNIGLKFGGILVSYMFTMMVTNLFGADVYGSFTIGFVVISLVSMLSTFGLGSALLKFIASEDGENNNAAIKNLFLSAYSIVGLASVLAAVLVYLGADSIATKIFQKPELSEILRIAAIGIVPTALLNVNSQALRGAERIEAHMFFEHVSRYFLPLALIPVLAQSWNGSHLVISVFVGCLWILWLISSIYYLRVSGFWISKREEKAVLRTLMVVALPLILAKSSGFLKNWSDTMIIGSYLDTDQTGIYNVVIRISKLLAIPLTAINAMQAPRIAKLFAKDDMPGLRAY
ncbi:MAG: O-antigen/teichoic acid export membrane protein, partial [Granulosicoccus sp.]